MPKEINRIKIESSSICYGPIPDIGEQTKQIIDINDKGKVKIKRYKMSKKLLYVLYETKETSIDEELSKKIIKEISNTFEIKKNKLEYFTDNPEYELKLYVDKKVVDEFHYPISNIDFLVNLSNMVRENLNQKDLWLFDGQGMQADVFACYSI